MAEIIITILPGFKFDQLIGEGAQGLTRTGRKKCKNDNYDILSGFDFAKNYMFAIQMGGFRESNEELGSVGVWATCYCRKKGNKERCKHVYEKM